MKVILSADVPNLGEEGDVRDVKRGYARNFLLPRNMAMPYNKQSLAVIESRRAAIEKRKEEKRRGALDLKQQIEELVVNLKMPAGENGRLFGAVTSATITEELSRANISVERKRIEIPEHTIKVNGNYRVRVRLYGNEEASLRVQVNVQEGGEATAKKAEAAPAKAEATETAVAEAEPEVAAEAEEAAETAEEEVAAASTEAEESEDSGSDE